MTEEERGLIAAVTSFFSILPTAMIATMYIGAVMIVTSTDVAARSKDKSNRAKGEQAWTLVFFPKGGESWRIEP